MERAKYGQVILDAWKDLETLLKQRSDLDKSITQLKATIVALTPLTNQTAPIEFVRKTAEETGLTEGCREVLKAAANPLTLVEVKEQLSLLGYNLKKYSNALASIHAVLKRLVEGEEAHKMRTSQQHPVRYEWGKAKGNFEMLTSLAKKGAPFGTKGEKS